MKLKLPSWHLVNKILVLCDAGTIKLEILINPKKNCQGVMDHGKVSLIAVSLVHIGSNTPFSDKLIIVG